MDLRARSDDVRGWAGSVVLHLLLALLLFLWRIDAVTGEPEYIEVGWGSVAAVTDYSSARPALPGSEGSVRVPALQPSRPADLPERAFNTGTDRLSVPRGSKLEADAPVSARRTGAAERSLGQKERSAGLGTGRGKDVLAAGSGDVAGDVRNPEGPVGLGSGVGSDVAMSMQWEGGGTRRKIDGELPKYPRGVKTEAQIILAAVVTPDGAVRSVKPAQKGDSRLEEAGMAAVRRWRFEPLRSTSPAVDQTCRITFNFSLR
jgi:TonB family protein